MEQKSVSDLVVGSEIIQKPPLARIKASDLVRAVELTEFVAHRKKGSKKGQTNSWLVFSPRGIEIVCTDDSRLSRVRIGCLKKNGEIKKKEAVPLYLPSLSVVALAVNFGLGNSGSSEKTNKLSLWELPEGNLLVSSPLLSKSRVISKSPRIGKEEFELDREKFSPKGPPEVKARLKVFDFEAALRGLPRRGVVLKSEFDPSQGREVLKISGRSESEPTERVCPVSSLEGEGFFATQAIYLRQVLQAVGKGEISISWGESDEPVSVRIPGNENFVHIMLTTLSRS